MSDDAFRGGLRCPVDDCPFEMAIQCATEEEVVSVSAAATQAHSDYAHGGAAVSLYDVPVLPGNVEAPGDEPPVEERPRLVN